MGEGYLVVKNFDKFQHYKSKLSVPAWIKLHKSLLTDYEFQSLSDLSKAHLMLIWLLVSQRSDRRIPNDPAWIAQKIGAKEPVNLPNLIASGWLICLERFQKAPRPRLDKTRSDQTRRRRAERALPIPVDFTLDEKDQIFAEERNVAAPREFAEFLAFHQAKGDVMLDWHAAWRTWILRAAKWASQRSFSLNSHKSGESKRPPPTPAFEVFKKWERERDLK